LRRQRYASRFRAGRQNEPESAIESDSLRAQRRLSIATWQMSYAKKGNGTMLVWLGKQPVDRGGLGQPIPAVSFPPAKRPVP
jgi:hypothetical protein